MSNLKKTVISSVVAVLAIAGVIVMSIILAGGGNTVSYSETFEGTLSVSVFKSASAAARGYLGEQISGTASEPEYKGETVLYELSRAEAETLVGDGIDGFISVKKVKIAYDDAYSKDNTVETYLIEFENGWKYFTPLPTVGDPISKAYMDDVFKTEKYLNCTSSTVMDMYVNDPNLALPQISYRQTVEFEDNKAHFLQDLPSGKFDAYFSEKANGGVEAFLKDPNNSDDDKYYSGYDIEKKYNGKIVFRRGGQQIELDDLDKIEEVVKFMFTLNVDASYFRKTDYGFEMRPEIYKKICAALVGDSESVENMFEKHRLFFYGRFYVSEGRLCRQRILVKACDGASVFSITLDTRFDGFGTTSVTFPFDNSQAQ